MIVDGLEDFFSVMVYPNKKYLKTSIIICLGFLLFSLVSLVFDIFTFVSWQEALTGLIMLLIIYVASITTMGDINKVTSLIKNTAVNVTNKTVKNKSKKKTKRKVVASNGKKQ